MLTDAANGANAPPRAVMQSIAEIARRDGVSKPTVSIAVKRLIEQHGLTVERDGQGRVALVNVAEYDHLRGRYGDPSKAQAPTRTVAAPAAPASMSLGAHETYDEALRQKTWHEAEKRRLELAEIKGALVRRDRLTAAIERCGEEIVRVFDRLPLASDELAAAVAKGGTHEVRLALKGLATRMRADVAKSLNRLASDTPATEEDAVAGEST